MSIGISPDYWGQGFGQESIKLLLPFAFWVLNLHRLSLTVFSYNTRAIQLYKRLGFVQEGIARQAIQRDGQCFDLLY